MCASRCIRTARCIRVELLVYIILSLSFFDISTHYILAGLHIWNDISPNPMPQKVGLWNAHIDSLKMNFFSSNPRQVHTECDRHAPELHVPQPQGNCTPVDCFEVVHMHAQEDEFSVNPGFQKLPVGFQQEPGKQLFKQGLNPGESAKLIG